MTHKEKAAELIDKFRAAEISYFEAKQCAIIAVTEVIENNRNLLDTISYHTELNYLQEVLTELNQL